MLASVRARYEADITRSRYETINIYLDNPVGNRRTPTTFGRNR